MNTWLIVGGIAVLLADVGLFARYRGRVRHLGFWTFPLFVIGLALLMGGLR